MRKKNILFTSRLSPTKGLILASPIWTRCSFRSVLKTTMVTFWWLRPLNSLMRQNAAMKYSEVKWPGLDPAVEWPCLCWQQPFDTEDRGQDKSSVLLYTCVGFWCFWHSLWSSVVALASRDTQTVGWHRNVTETKRLKPPQTILLFVQCRYSV